MNNPAEIQEFLQRMLASDEPIVSNARTESGDTDTTVQVNITRVVENGLTTIRIGRNSAVFNALVSSGTSQDQFGTPQEYVDAVSEFVNDADNDIEVSEGAFVNERTPDA
jgi:hypothetical protein